MEYWRRLLHILGFLAALPATLSAQSNPLAKVQELLQRQKEVIYKDAAEAESAYRSFKTWCVDATAKQSIEVKSRQESKNKLQATVQQTTTDVEDSQAKVQEIADELAQHDKDLADATSARDDENKEFQSSEKKLVDAVDMLARAIAALNKGGKAGAASFAQKSFRGLQPVLIGLGAVIDAAGIRSSLPSEKLTAMIQELEGPGDQQGAQASAIGKRSKIVIEVMEDMRDKAGDQLAKVRAAEQDALHTYNILKASVEHAVENGNKEMQEVKQELLKSQELLASTQGELDLVAKALSDVKRDLKTTQSTCIGIASDHEKSRRGVDEELKVLETARKLLLEVSGENQLDFIQLSAVSKQKRRSSISMAVNKEVLGVITRVAHEQNSAELSQLASRVSALMKFTRVGGVDPFKKLKELIRQMLEKLQRELDEEIEQKAWCDDEIAKTEESNEDLSDKIEGIKSQLDESMSTSATLKEETKAITAELVDLANLRKQLDDQRSEQQAAFERSKVDFERGLKSVQAAIKVLRSYYSSEDSALLLQTSTQEGEGQPERPKNHEKSQNMGQQLIGMLEIVESDTVRIITDINTENEDEIADYERAVQQGEVAKAEREKSMQYKSNQLKSLNKEIADLTKDYGTASTELEARKEYLEKVRIKCKGAWANETFEDRKKRREQELKGLLEAQAVLEGQTASFLQRPKLVQSPPNPVQ